MMEGQGRFHRPREVPDRRIVCVRRGRAAVQSRDWNAWGPQAEAVFTTHSAPPMDHMSGALLVIFGSR